MENNREKLMNMDIEQELRKSFISYAMAVIINRALPDVRDGLKPVHRRILYSMMELGVTPDKPFRKSARIVGDVLGKYHPHGDSAVYDTMVRLAQDFVMRAPLISGQGNFGSVDGDEAAAMRYTEAKLSPIAMELVRDLDKETVEFYPNFDETAMQPAVLPSRYPNLLVNGSSGIAVGMATNIPPHNLGEVIDGAVAMIDNPDITIEELMQHIKGPDFPTGGIIMGVGGALSAYRTGRGKITVRARTEIEEDGNRQRIVVTEIPYMVNKARLVEKIAELVQEKRVEGISDLRDETSREGMRVVIDLKRDANAQVVLNTLYKHTQLQDSFGVIMLALVDGEPRVLSLQQMLRYYLEHQVEVIERRTKYELEKALARAHILEGLLIALDDIDNVIRTIRASRTTQDAREALVTNFGLSEKQAVAILDMRLQRLTGLEREKIQAEYDELQKTIAHLRDVLADRGMVMGIIREEMLDIRARYSDERRTEITFDASDINIEDLIDREDMVVTLTQFGYVKRLASSTYRAQRRGGRGISGLSTREEDFVKDIFVTSTHDDLYFFTDRGRMYRLKCYEIPEAGRTAKGTAIVNLLPLTGEEKVTAIVPVSGEERAAEGYLVMATRQGLIKKTDLAQFQNLRSAGLIAIALNDDDELIGVKRSRGDDEIIMGTRGGMSIRFSEQDVRPMGRNSHGVRSIRLDGDDRVVTMDLVDKDASMLCITEKGYGKRTAISEYRLQSRHGKGIKATKLTRDTGMLVGFLMVQGDEDIMLITDEGTIIRMAVDTISEVSRTARGVRMMRLQGDSSIVAVARVDKEEEEPEGEENAAETLGGEE